MVIDLLDGVFGSRITGALIRIADVLSVLCLGTREWQAALSTTRPSARCRGRDGKEWLVFAILPPNGPASASRSGFARGSHHRFPKQ